jgi:hypothetical protein
MVMESVRALGNFSRDVDFREDMLKTRGTPLQLVHVLSLCLLEDEVRATRPYAVYFWDLTT